MFPIVSTYRDFREFLAAKKRKREPLRIVAKPIGCAIYRPSGARGFANFRAALRGVGDWGQASERLDQLEHALRARHQIGLPLPRKVMQNEDRSLSVFWTGAMVRCLPDGFVSLIGGTEGIPAKAITRELLDLLAFQMRIAG
jgi:hypothetical protein